MIDRMNRLLRFERRFSVKVQIHSAAWRAFNIGWQVGAAEAVDGLLADTPIIKKALGVSVCFSSYAGEDLAP
jgi:hypothetical protein